MEETPQPSEDHLAVVSSVRCLECGAIYPKPTGGGTVRSNPGCPECGYLGWVGVRGRADAADDAGARTAASDSRRRARTA